MNRSFIQKSQIKNQQDYDPIVFNDQQSPSQKNYSKTRNNKSSCNSAYQHTPMQTSKNIEDVINWALADVVKSSKSQERQSQNFTQHKQTKLLNKQLFQSHVFNPPYSTQLSQIRAPSQIESYLDRTTDDHKNQVAVSAEFFSMRNKQIRDAKWKKRMQQNKFNENLPNNLDVDLNQLINEDNYKISNKQNHANTSFDNQQLIDYYQQKIKIHSNIVTPKPDISKNQQRKRNVNNQNVTNHDLSYGGTVSIRPDIVNINTHNFEEYKALDIDFADIDETFNISSQNIDNSDINSNKQSPYKVQNKIGGQRHKRFLDIFKRKFL